MGYDAIVLEGVKKPIKPNGLQYLTYSDKTSRDARAKQLVRDFVPPLSKFHHKMVMGTLEKCDPLQPTVIYIIGDAYAAGKQELVLAEISEFIHKELSKVPFSERPTHRRVVQFFNDLSDLTDDFEPITL